MFTTKNLLILIGKQMAIALVAVVCAFIVVSFISHQIENVTGTIVKNHQLADKLAKRTELFSVLARDIATVGKNDIIIEHAFVPADNIIEFILALENLGAKNGVVQSFHFGNPTSAPDASPFPLATVDYSNTLTLNITSFSKYLKSFESLPYFTRIDGLSFSAKDISGWQNGGSATYRAVLYTNATSQ